MVVVTGRDYYCTELFVRKRPLHKKDARVFKAGRGFFQKLTAMQSLPYRLDDIENGSYARQH